MSDDDFSATLADLKRRLQEQRETPLLGASQISSLCLQHEEGQGGDGVPMTVKQPVGRVHGGNDGVEFGAKGNRSAPAVLLVACDAVRDRADQVRHVLLMAVQQFTERCGHVFRRRHDGLLSLVGGPAEGSQAAASGRGIS